MSAEHNKAIVRKMVEELQSGHNLDAVDALFAADFVDHSVPPGLPPSREGVKMQFAMFFSAFPDLHVVIHDQVAEGDRKVVAFGLWDSEADLLASERSYNQTKLAEVSGLLAGPPLREAYEVSVQVDIIAEGGRRIFVVFSAWNAGRASTKTHEGPRKGTLLSCFVCLRVSLWIKYAPQPQLRARASAPSACC